MGYEQNFSDDFIIFIDTMFILPHPSFITTYVLNKHTS